MRFFNLLKKLPPFIRCFLALAWLAHNTFLGSSGNPRGFLLHMRVDLPKIVPPFIRRRACSTLQGSGFTRYVADGNLKGLLCMRVDLPKIVPPFILRRRC